MVDGQPLAVEVCGKQRPVQLPSADQRDGAALQGHDAHDRTAVAALTERGVPALGVDIAYAAVWLTRRQGGPALRRSVFDRVPGEGRWPTALLMDGNVGIGGDPVQLLHRIRQLLAPSGRLIVEAHPDAHADGRAPVRFQWPGSLAGAPFPWAEIGLHALRRDADRAGYIVDEVWSVGGRSFAVLRP